MSEPVKLLERGHCKSCGQVCFRFERNGKLGTFHREPVCASFVAWSANNATGTERVVLDTNKQEMRPETRREKFS